MTPQQHDAEATKIRADAGVHTLTEVRTYLRRVHADLCHVDGDYAAIELLEAMLEDVAVYLDTPMILVDHAVVNGGE